MGEGASCEAHSKAFWATCIARVTLLSATLSSCCPAKTYKQICCMVTGAALDPSHAGLKVSQFPETRGRHLLVQGLEARYYIK